MVLHLSLNARMCIQLNSLEWYCTVMQQERQGESSALPVQQAQDSLAATSAADQGRY